MTASGVTADHSYSSAGVFSVTLTLTLASGEETSIVHTAEVTHNINATGPYTYQTFVSGVHSLYANNNWHAYPWWGDEGFNPVEIPVVGGDPVSIRSLGGKIDFDYTGTLGVRAVYYDAEGSHSNGIANNGVRWYTLTGLWVSSISYDEPYWNFTPIGSEFEVGSNFTGTAPANAVALLLGSTDPNFVVDQTEIDRVSYFSQELLGHVDNSGKWDIEVTSGARPTNYPPFDIGDTLYWDDVLILLEEAGL